MNLWRLAFVVAQHCWYFLGLRGREAEQLRLWPLLFWARPRARPTAEQRASSDRRSERPSNSRVTIAGLEAKKKGTRLSLLDRRRRSSLNGWRRQSPGLIRRSLPLAADRGHDQWLEANTRLGEPFWAINLVVLFRRSKNTDDDRS